MTIQTSLKTPGRPHRTHRTHRFYTPGYPIVKNYKQNMKKLKIKELDKEEKLVKINGSYRVPDHDHNWESCDCFAYLSVNENLHE